MPRTPRNIIFHELIGLPVKVLSHYDPSLVGLEGVIVWETARTIHVRVRGGRTLVILKSGALFALQLPGGEEVVVRGDHLLGRPSDRAKRMVRGWR